MLGGRINRLPDHSFGGSMPVSSGGGAFVGCLLPAERGSEDFGLSIY